MKSETVLITGASSGIGLHLAREFAKHGHPLVLVAPVESELRRVAAELESQFGVSAAIIAKDLEEPDAASQVFEQLSRAAGSIDILVNNAGHGQKGKFWEIDIDRHLSIVRLNIEAPLRLTRLFLPPMLSRKSGRILNVASIAGFEPGPSLAVYHASKAFVLSWSEALAEELVDTGVSLTTLCPGPTDTDFFEKADMVQTRAFQEGNLMAPQEVAQDAYAALMKGERVIVSGAMNKVMVFSRRFLPGIAQAKKNEALYQDVKKTERIPHEKEAEAAKP